MFSIAVSTGLYTNEYNQIVIVPKIFQNEFFLNHLRLLAGTQIGMNNSVEAIRGEIEGDCKQMGIPMFFQPKISRVLPAMATIIYHFLDANRGKLDHDGFPVSLTFNDIYNIITEMGIAPLVNKNSLRSGFCNIINKKRDDINRQMLTDLFKDVKSTKISFLKERGRPQKGYYFKK